LVYSAGMPHQEPSLRQQLLEARAKVQRQIDLLQEKPRPFPVSDDGVNFIGESGHLIGLLKETLRKIEDGLARLGPDDI